MAQTAVAVALGLVDDGDPGIPEDLIPGQAETGTDIHVFTIQEIPLIEPIDSSKQPEGKQQKKTGYPIHRNGPVGKRIIGFQRVAQDPS